MRIRFEEQPFEVFPPIALEHKSIRVQIAPLFTEGMVWIFLVQFFFFFSNPFQDRVQFSVALKWVSRAQVNSLAAHKIEVWPPLRYGAEFLPEYNLNGRNP